MNKCYVTIWAKYARSILVVARQARARRDDGRELIGLWVECAYIRGVTRREVDAAVGTEQARRVKGRPRRTDCSGTESGYRCDRPSDLLRRAA